MDVTLAMDPPNSLHIVTSEGIIFKVYGQASVLKALKVLDHSAVIDFVAASSPFTRVISINEREWDKFNRRCWL